MSISIYNAQRSADQRRSTFVPLSNNTTAISKSRARIARTLQLECDMPPTARERGEVGLDRHLRTRYLPNQVPFVSLRCAAHIHAEDVALLAFLFHKYSVLATDEEEALSEGGSGLTQLKTTLEDNYQQLLRDEQAAADGWRSGSGSGGIGSGGGGGRAERQRSITGRGSSPAVPEQLGRPAGAAPSPPSRPLSPAQRREEKLGSLLAKSNLTDRKRMQHDEDEEHVAALSKEWLVELLLDMIAQRLPESTAALTSTALTSPLTPTGASTSHRMSTASMASFGNSFSSAMQPGVSTTGNGLWQMSSTFGRTMTAATTTATFVDPAAWQRRRAREATLAECREELLQWLQPLVELCDAQHRAAAWERCEAQAAALESYHRWACKEDPAVDGAATTGTGDAGMSTTLHPAANFSGNFSTTTGAPPSLSAASTIAPSPAAVHSEPSPHSPVKRQGAGGGGAGGGGAGGSPSPGRGAAVVRLLTPGLDERDAESAGGKANNNNNNNSSSNAGAEGSGLTGRMSSFRYDGSDALEMNSLCESSVHGGTEAAYDSCCLSWYGERTDGTEVPTWQDALLDPSQWCAEVSARTQRLLEQARQQRAAAKAAGTPPPPRPKSKKMRRHRAPEQHEYISWNVLTNNFIMGEDTERETGYQGTTYVRVATAMLEEGDGANDGAVVGQEVHDDSDEEPDGTAARHSESEAIGGPRSRKHRRKQHTTQLMDTDEVTEEVRHLHTQSIDHIVASANGKRLYTSSKDSTVKVWDAKRGTYLSTLLHLGTSWALALELLHQDAYLLVATTNAEITIVDVVAGTTVKKLRGCAALETALRHVVQHNTEYMERFGMRPGECGPHRPTFKEDMSAPAFARARKDAQRSTSTSSVTFPVHPVEGFVSPTAFYFDAKLSFGFFGNAVGVVGCFDLTDMVQYTALLSGAAVSATASLRALSLLHHVQAHPADTRVTGIAHISSAHCIFSVAEDGSVMRLALTRDELAAVQRWTFGPPVAVHYTPRRAVRFLAYCPVARLLATSHSDRRVLVWSVGHNTAEVVHVFPQETQDITSIAFMAEQQQVALMLADHSVRVYDFRGYRPLTTITTSRDPDCHAVDVAAFITQVSTEDDDGCLAYLPGCRRLVMGLRGPVLYEPASQSKQQQEPSAPEERPTEEAEEAPQEYETPLPVSPPRVASPGGRRRSSSYLSSFAQMEEEGLLEGSEEAQELRRHRFVEQAAQREEVREQLAAELLAQRRLQPGVTHTKGIVGFAVNQKKAELHTLTADSWKVWDLYSGALKKETDLPAQVRQLLPMYARVVVTSCGWTTDACTRIIAGARGGLMVTLDAETVSVVDVEPLERQPTNSKGDTDVRVVEHRGPHTLLCAGRTCLIRRYAVGALLPVGTERSNTMRVRVPAHGAITASCIVRDTHFCLGTSEAHIYLYRMLDESTPYAEEALVNPFTGEPEMGAVVGLQFINEANQNVIAIVLETGVLQVYSYLKGSFIGRVRLMPEHTCFLRKVLFVPSEGFLIVGDSLGVVRVFDLWRYLAVLVPVSGGGGGGASNTTTADLLSTMPTNSSSFAGVSTSAVGNLTVTAAANTGRPRRERLLLLYAFQASSDEVVELDYFESVPSAAAPSPSAMAPPGGILSSSMIKGGRGLPAVLRKSFHGGRQKYVIAGSSNGNVGLFALQKAVPGQGGESVVGASERTLSVSAAEISAMGRPEGGPAAMAGTGTTVGLFGLDRWDLLAADTYSGTVIPPSATAAAAKRQNEVLAALVTQARRQHSPAAAPTAGPDATAAAATSTPTDRPSSERCRSKGSRRAARPHTSTTEEEQAAAAAAEASGKFFTAPHTVHSLLPTSAPPAPVPTLSHTAPATTAAAAAAAPEGKVLTESTQPQRRLLESTKYSRNPLLKAYPMRWLQRLGVVAPGRSLQPGADAMEDVVVPADMAFDGQQQFADDADANLECGTATDSFSHRSSVVSGPGPYRRDTAPVQDASGVFLTAITHAERGVTSPTEERVFSFEDFSSGAAGVLKKRTSAVVGVLETRDQSRGSFTSDGHRRSVASSIYSSPTASQRPSLVEGTGGGGAGGAARAGDLKGITWGDGTQSGGAAGGAAAPADPKTAALPVHVLEQRRDQLMLAHLARGIDRAQPQARERDTLTAQLQRRWVDRSRDAATAAATREALLHRDHPRPTSTPSTEGKPAVPNAAFAATVPAGNTNPLSAPNSAVGGGRPAAATTTPQRLGSGGGLGLNLDLLGCPIEAQDVDDRADDALTARERLERRLKDMKKVETQQRQQRHERVQRLQDAGAATGGGGTNSAEPFHGAAYLPHVTLKQQLHPVAITLPSTMAGDEGARWQLEQMARRLPKAGGGREADGPSSLAYRKE